MRTNRELLETMQNVKVFGSNRDVLIAANTLLNRFRKYYASGQLSKEDFETIETYCIKVKHFAKKSA